MLFPYENYKVLLACGKTDMRNNMNALCEIVQHQFQLDPTEPVLFAFCNRDRNRLKLLVWEENGFWMHLKRFEKGRIPWPVVTDTEQAMPLCKDDFENLLKSPTFSQKIKREEVWKKY